MALTPLDDARRHVFDRCLPLAPRPTPVGEAFGLVLAEWVTSSEQIPSFDNTAVDGFAVRAADTDAVATSADGTARLRVVDTVLAGRAPTRAVGPGEAIRIMTGAPVPDGADAVVMVERTRIVRIEAGDADELVEIDTDEIVEIDTDEIVEIDTDEIVEIDTVVRAGENIRRAGGDVQPGDQVLAPRTVLGPAQLGVLASLGVTEVLAHPRARVGVLSTGDELVVGDRPLGPGQIRDSNRPALLAAVRDAGAEPVDLGRILDDEDAIEAAYLRGAAECDAVLSSGGVSMGDVDLVKVVLDRIGAMRWMQVAIKPAKPFAFGVVGAEPGVPCFGLPGNPVSSLVSFELFARPALRQMMGHQRTGRVVVRAVADAPFERRPDGKTHFFRVVSESGGGEYRVRPAGGQGSHQLAAMALADGLAIVPDGDGIAFGGDVSVMLLVS